MTVENRDTKYLYDQITVVIPTLNEEEAIGPVIDEILSLGIPKSNILVVDGRSTDRTREIAEGKGVRVVLQEGKGKADAIKTAAKYVATPIVVFMDGDYTYPAGHIPELAGKVLEGYDLVIGQRNPVGSAQKPVFSFGNRVLSRMFNLLYGVNVRDVLSGMYALRSDILHELSFQSRGFGIESEIVAHVASTGGRITEVPIKYRERLGRKKLGVKHGFHILVDMVKLAWSYNPSFLIFALGALLLLPGLVLDFYVGYHYVFHEVRYYVKGLIGVALTTTGVISLALTLMTLYLKRMEIRLLKHLRQCREQLRKGC